MSVWALVAFMDVLQLNLLPSCLGKHSCMVLALIKGPAFAMQHCPELQDNVWDERTIVLEITLLN